MKWLVVLMMGLATAGATKPSTSPTSRPAAATRRAETAARNAALQSAIAELTREIHTALRAGKEPPRQQSDYFASNGNARKSRTSPYP